MKNSISINSLIQVIHSVKINIARHEALLNSEQAATLSEDDIYEHGDTTMLLMKLSSELSTAYDLERERHYPMLPSYAELENLTAYNTATAHELTEPMIMKNTDRATSIATSEAIFSLQLNIKLHRELLGNAASATLPEKLRAPILQTLSLLLQATKEFGAIYEEERLKAFPDHLSYDELCTRFIFV